jgi:hypothetical protein
MSTDVTATAAPADETAVRGAIDQIKTELRNLARNEGNAVASHLRIGKALAELRAQTKSGWFAQLEELGINARVARRYISLGNSPLAASGLGESALLEQLPPDLMKLEWLGQPQLEQLRELLLTLDCKTAGRSQVNAAAKKMLGRVVAAPTAPNIEKAAAKIFERLYAEAGRLLDTAPPQHLERARELLADGLRQALEELAGVPKNPVIQAGADQEDNGEVPLAS